MALRTTEMLILKYNKVDLNYTKLLQYTRWCRLEICTLDPKMILVLTSHINVSFVSGRRQDKYVRRL